MRAHHPAVSRLRRMDKTRRNIHIRCKYRAAQTLTQLPCAQSIQSGMLPNIPHSRSACTHRKEKPSETDSACQKFAVLQPAPVPETSRAARLKLPKLSCCRTKGRSTPDHLQELRSIPCMQLHTPCTRYKSTH